LGSGAKPDVGLRPQALANQMAMAQSCEGRRSSFSSFVLVFKHAGANPFLSPLVLSVGKKKVEFGRTMQTQV